MSRRTNKRGAIEPLESRTLLAGSALFESILTPQQLHPTIRRLDLRWANATTRSIFGSLSSVGAPSRANAASYIHPVSYVAFTVDEPSLRNVLDQAPLEFTSAAQR